MESATEKTFKYARQTIENCKVVFEITKETMERLAAITEIKEKIS